MNDYSVHPAADIFPLMSSDQLNALAEDIRQHGQKEPAVLWREQLIDGRNRSAACTLIGIELDVSELDEDADPLEEVLSANLHRRQLKQSQRAMCAAKMANLEHGSNQYEQKVEVQICTSTCAEDAAKLFTISRMQVFKAKNILENGCKLLIELVERAEVTVHLADKFVREVPSKSEQLSIVRKGKQAMKDFITPNDRVIEPVKTSSIDDFLDVWENSNEQQRKKICDYVLAHKGRK